MFSFLIFEYFLIFISCSFIETRSSSSLSLSFSTSSSVSSLSDHFNKFNLDSKSNSSTFKITKHYYHLPKIPFKFFPLRFGDEIQRNSLQTVYHKVMNKLKPSKDQIKKLDFYNDKFARNLFLFTRKDSNLKSSSFWYNLTRLLFKWMIYIKEQTANKKYSLENFRNSLMNIRKVNSVIFNNNQIIAPFSFNLKSMGKRALNTFESLIKCEIFENNHIFTSLADSIKDFLDNLYNPKDGKTACQLLKIKYFNGCYEKNILLKYSILFYSPIGKMRDCILMDDWESRYSPWYHSRLSGREETIKNYLLDLKIRGSKNPGINLLEDENYLTKSVFEFLQSSGRKIRIDFSFHIFHLLKVLNRIGLLKWKVIEDLVGFKIKNVEFPRWDQEQFERIIKSLKMDSNFRNKLPKLEIYLKRLGPFNSDE